MNIAGAILSGGKSKRMGGRNKAFIEIDGIPLIQNTINVFKQIFEEIILVTNSPEEYKQYNNDCKIITDIIKNVGPLGGIHAALSYTDKEAVFFIACDMPFLHNDLIDEQIRIFNSLVKCDALLPRIGMSAEPLCGIYKKELKDSIDSFLKEEKGYAVKKFLDTVKISYLDMEDNPFNKNRFINLNTPEDLTRKTRLKKTYIRNE